MAYANPEDRRDERKRADGYGIARFNKNERTVTFECWPRFADVRDGDAAQFAGWPLTIRMADNDGRPVVGWLPELIVNGVERPVVQVTEEATGEILYTVRMTSNRFRVPVYTQGAHTVKLGRDKPDAKTLTGLVPAAKNDTARKTVNLEGSD